MSLPGLHLHLMERCLTVSRCLMPSLGTQISRGLAKATPAHLADTPVDTPVHPEHTLAHPEHTLAHPEHTLAHPEHTLAHPADTLVHPAHTLAHPEHTLAHPEHTLAHPEHSPANTLEHQAQIPEHPAQTPEPLAPTLDGQHPFLHILEERHPCHAPPTTHPGPSPPTHRECTLLLGSHRVVEGNRTPQRVCLLLQWFQLDFKKGNDIAFHFNPRFNEDNRKVVVCNTKLHENWGKEERTAPRFPFEAGKPFKIQVLCEADHLKVAVDDAHLLQYNHRIRELNQITKLCVAGDISLTSITPTMI
ncbi:UNVERIFIED_CONTAM: hypothetical protein K2H54_013245 [Gekko kuhli]